MHQLLTAKGRIAAATYRITLVHCRYSLQFTIGPGMQVPPPKKKLPVPQDWARTTLVHPSPHPNRHLDQFGRFRRAHDGQRQSKIFQQRG